MLTIANTLLSYVIPLIFVLGVLIFFHELGHFIFAKLSGIRVERFSLGFPPRLIGKKIGDTDYCISAVPFGGYVKMSGMIDESLDKDGIKGEPYEFMSKPIGVRAMVIAAGPMFNVLLTVIIFACSVYFQGVPKPVGPVVEVVIEDYPAMRAGLQSGDVITRVDEQPIETWQDVTSIIHNHSRGPLEIEWKRNGETLSATITPRYVENQLGEAVYMIGISPKTKMVQAGVFESIGFGFSNTWNLTKMMFKAFGLLFSGEVSAKEGLAGPIRIAQMAGESAKSGMGNLFIFTALISLNLGILNLLPIPVLDGGHLLLLGTEAVMRRPLSVRVRMVIQQIGMVVLLAIMLFVIINDVIQVW